jgi:hypothetical protein
MEERRKLRGSTRRFGSRLGCVCRRSGLRLVNAEPLVWGLSCGGTGSEGMVVGRSVCGQGGNQAVGVEMEVESRGSPRSVETCEASEMKAVAWSRSLVRTWGSRLGVTDLVGSHMD